ncbi:MAG: hypothetical protein ACXW5U_30445 [Thermoanaerobaculia bacterium]
MPENQVPTEVKNRLHGWFKTFWAFPICHYTFGIGGVLASTIAASSRTEGSATGVSTVQVAGVVAAVCMAVIGFVRPEEKYRRYVVAWRLLDEKVNLYRHGFIDLKVLIEGMTAAERAIDQIERETRVPGSPATG